MTDKQVFEKFMLWMGMKVLLTKKVDKNAIITYKDTMKCDARFTKEGYEEFYTGAVFDKNGKIIKAYIDSHVADVSDNCTLINRMVKDAD